MQISKFTSRKFWMSAAAFLASIGGAITGVATNNETLTIVGFVCTMLSAAIYSAVEAYVDAAREESSQTNTSITASTTAKEVVEKVLTDANAA